MHTSLRDAIATSMVRYVLKNPVRPYAWPCLETGFITHAFNTAEALRAMGMGPDEQLVEEIEGHLRNKPYIGELEKPIGPIKDITYRLYIHCNWPLSLSLE